MPGGRRSIGKPGVGRSPTGGSSDEFLKSKWVIMIEIPMNALITDFNFAFFYFSDFRCSINTLNDPLSCKVASPKHIPIPHIPQESTIVFELYMFIFTTVASFLQFLHLYRSVWWLPQSYTRYTMVRLIIMEI